MYTIKRVAELTGLPPATLRAWERRYGVVTPERTESGYRLYDDAAVGALRVMAELLERGFAPREAAAEVRRRQPTGDEQDPGPTGVGPEPGLTGVGPEPGLAAGAPHTQMLADVGQEPGPARGPGGGRPSAPARPATPGRDALGHPPTPGDLVDAAARLDGEAVAAVLDERFALTSFEVVVDEWLMPALAALGEAWAAGRVSVAGEHLAAYAVMRRLAAAYEAAAVDDSGPRIVVGLPPGCRHELGALAFAAAARRQGLAATYVGADLPVADWVEAVLASQPRAVVLSVLREQDLPALGGVVRSVRLADPQMLVFVGGAAAALAPQGCVRLTGSVAAAARSVARRLSGQRAEAHPDRLPDPDRELRRPDHRQG
jgi:MerR family transcriptional regulator, light-induced transcriptional regulator